MQLLFNVPPEADGVLLRGFLRRCAVSTELARAVKFHGSGFFADDAPILANRRVQAGQTIRFALPADGPAWSRSLRSRSGSFTRMLLPWCWKNRPIWRSTLP